MRNSVRSASFNFIPTENLSFKVQRPRKTIREFKKVNMPQETLESSALQVKCVVFERVEIQYFNAFLRCKQAHRCHNERNHFLDHCADGCCFSWYFFTHPTTNVQQPRQRDVFVHKTYFSRHRDELRWVFNGDQKSAIVTLWRFVARTFLNSLSWRYL